MHGELAGLGGGHGGGSFVGVEEGDLAEPCRCGQSADELVADAHLDLARDQHEELVARLALHDHRSSRAGPCGVATLGQADRGSVGGAMPGTVQPADGRRVGDRWAATTAPSTGAAMRQPSTRPLRPLRATRAPRVRSPSAIRRPVIAAPTAAAIRVVESSAPYARLVIVSEHDRWSSVWVPISISPFPAPRSAANASTTTSRVVSPTNSRGRVSIAAPSMTSRLNRRLHATAGDRDGEHRADSEGDRDERNDAPAPPELVECHADEDQVERADEHFGGADVEHDSSGRRRGRHVPMPRPRVVEHGTNREHDGQTVVVGEA